MKKYEKEILQDSLKNEEAVLKKLQKEYRQSVKDMNKVISELNTDIKYLQSIYDSIGDDGLGEVAQAYFAGKGKKRLKWATDNPEAAKETLQSMIRSKVYQKKYQNALKKQVNGILNTMKENQFNTIAEYLDKCYEEGFTGAMYALHKQGIPLIFPLDQNAMVKAVQIDSKISEGLYTKLGEDVDELKKKITSEVSRGISTGRNYKQVAQQLAAITTIGYNKAVRIARTEGNRISNQSAMDAAQKAKDKGCDVMKQWNAALDGRTRRSHAQCDGEIRELDEAFSNGLMMPSDPDGKASEVINCRCRMFQIGKWELDDEELERLKERAAFYGLDKTAEFDDFKKKYLKAAEAEAQVENLSNNGIMNVKTVAEAKKALVDDIGFDKVVKSISSVDDRLLISSTNQLSVLEAKFGAVHKSKSSISSKAGGSGTMAFVSREFANPTNQDLVLCPKGYQSFDKMIDSVKRSIISGWHMPAALTDDELARYVVTHEYGHILHNTIYRSEMEKQGWTASKPYGMADYTKKTTKAIYKWYYKLFEATETAWQKEIIEIAKKNNPDFDLLGSISKYGMTNKREFFAEVFANSQLSKPNELGKAMNEWLEQKGLIIK